MFFFVKMTFHKVKLTYAYFEYVQKMRQEAH